MTTYHSTVASTSDLHLFPSNSSDMRSPTCDFSNNSNLDICSQAGEESHSSNDISKNMNFSYNINNHNNANFIDRFAEKPSLNNETQNCYTENNYHYFNGFCVGNSTKNIIPCNSLESYDISDGGVNLTYNNYNGFNNYDTSSASSDFNSNFCSFNTEAITASYQPNCESVNQQGCYSYHDYQQMNQNQQLYSNISFPTIGIETEYYNSSRPQIKCPEHFSHHINQASQVNNSTIDDGNYFNCLV